MKFWHADVAKESTDETPGTVLNIEKEAIFIAAGERSVLRLFEVQPENRPRMKAHDFAIGHRVQPRKSFG